MQLSIPGFTILETLGQGGMATVYLAEQETLGRKVALKVLDPSLAANREFAQRFLKEGRVIAQLEHPHIITVHDIGKASGSYYIAMEYLRGGDLKQRIARGIEPDEALRILAQVASALTLAHRRGVIHRDIKPGNILFRDPRTAVLSDFGIAKLDTLDGEQTAAGWVIGTPYYMSPEQAMGRPATARSDLYGLGVVFFQMLTGTRPFEAGQARAPVDSGSGGPRLPDRYARFQVLADGLLAYDPARRFAGGEGLSAALEALEQGRTLVMPGDEAGAREGDETVVATPETLVAVAPAADESEPVQVSVSERDLEILPTYRRGETPVPAPGVDLRPWWLGAAVLALLLVAGGGYWWVADRFAPPAPPRVLTPAVQAKVQRLLDAAEAHELVGRYTAPPGSNALDAYRAVLALDPDNARARAGLDALRRGRGEP